MNRLNVQWTAKTLVNQMKRGNVNFDNAVQRGLVWDVEKKSLLIHSMVYGYAIPAMYFTRDENKVYDSLDGKQRSNAICEFMNDEFALVTDTPPVYDDDGNMEDISGMTFSQLPEWVQDRINEYSLTIYYYEDMTEQEIREFFRRLNNGKPLTAVELTRVNTPCLVVFQQLAEHDAIQNVVTAAGKRRFTDENIAMQLYHMATVENPDFSTKSFREWAKSVETDNEVIGKIQSGLDAYCSFFAELDPAADKKILRTIKTRTHFVSCAYYCYLAVQEEATQDEINQTLRTFFSGNPSTSEDYNKTVGSGSAKPGAVQTRQRIMQELAGVKAQKDTDAAEEKIEATQDQQDQKPLQESEVEKHGETGEQLTIEDGEKQE
mgnify:CR=1 FL=1|jgi:hypothetical protein